MKKSVIAGVLGLTVALSAHAEGITQCGESATCTAKGCLMADNGMSPNTYFPNAPKVRLSPGQSEAAFISATYSTQEASSCEYKFSEDGKKIAFLAAPGVITGTIGGAWRKEPYDSKCTNYDNSFMCTFRVNQ